MSANVGADHVKQPIGLTNSSNRRVAGSINSALLHFGVNPARGIQLRNLLVAILSVFCLGTDTLNDLFFKWGTSSQAP